MKHSVNQTLFAYWTWLRAGRAAPERCDIEPAAIRGVLADTFLLEVEDRGADKPFAVKFRLSGTRVNALFDREMKGQSLWPWWRTGDLATMQALVAAVLQDTTAAVVGLQGSPPGSPPLNLEMLLLPLRHHGKTQSRMMGSLAPATIPTWLGLVPIGPLNVTSHRMIESSAKSAEWRPAPPVRQPVGIRRLSPTRRGHFTIYEGGRSLENDESDTGLSRH